MTNQAVREHLTERQADLNTVQQIADGKSDIMFSKASPMFSESAVRGYEKMRSNLKTITDENFQELYEHEIGDLAEALFGKNMRVPTKQVQRRKSNGTIETYRTRDLDAIFDEKTGETFGEAAVRVVNTFLESNPQYRALLKNTMTGGDRGGFFLTVPNFNSKINKVDSSVEQVAGKKPYNNKGKFSEDFYNQRNSEKFRKENDGKLNDLKEFFVAIEAHLQNFPNDIWMFEEMLLDTSKHMNSVTRVLAPTLFYPVDSNRNPIFNQKAVEEHTDPQNLIGKALLAGAMFGKLDQVWKVVGKSYMQGSLLRVDDPSGVLKANMPQVYYDKVVPRLLSGDLKLPNGYSSIVRLAVSGIDPNAYILINEDMTIAEFFGVAGMPVETANDLITKQLTGEVDARYVTQFSKAARVMPGKSDIKKAVVFSKAVSNARLINSNTPSRGMSAFDFDETLIDKGENTIIATKDGEVIEIKSDQWPIQGPQLAASGYEFDFSDFINVKGGVEGPLMQKFRNRIKKYGIDNNYILTARPAEAAPAIQAWLESQGIIMPIENITGLGNSTGEAKAMWMAEKFSEGYNDMYFVDDALPNVKAVADMLTLLDVKGSSVQAKIQFSKGMGRGLNDMLERTTGVESKKTFSAAQAKIRGARGKYKGLVPASAQDFMGLLYNFLGKGKQGDKDMAFFKKALIDPFARGIDELNGAKQSAGNDYKKLTKLFPKVKKRLNKKDGKTGFTNDQAIRVYLWNKAGFEVPGLSKRDLKSLVDLVKNDSELQAFADALSVISKKTEGYGKPGEYWLVENIASDLISDGAIGEVRSEFLGEWQQNVDQIFSPENLNKIEAIYGSKFVEALKDSLYRMKTGKNRPQGSGRILSEYMNWVNGSIGAIMFFNIRSAVLQTISATNYINWSDNNPLKAAQAFANQKQFWSDFAMLFNSDYLKQRRSGNQRGVNEADLSAAVSGVGAYEQTKAAIRYLLKLGFLPTQIADSFAIASGGASFYRNRVKSLMKKGMDRAQAEKQAFIDFQETTEVSQQSARPDMISQQQANPLGRLILAFQNTPMQYGRIMNKAFRDIANGRGDTKTHVSKIIYYGGIQAVVFGALQSALFASLGDDDEEDFDKKTERIANQMVDSWLSVFGFGGKAVSTIKGTIQEFLEQKDKGFNADHAYTILALLGFSPPIGSKARKIYSAIQTDKFNEDVYGKRGFTLDNPIWNAIGNVIEGITNIPLGRLSNKMLNLDNVMDSTNEWWQRAALLLGWNTWDLGIKDKDIQEVKETIKEEKKVETKKKQIIKKEEKKVEKEKKEKEVVESNIEKQKKEKKEGKKDIKCAAVNKSGKRCGTTIEPGQSYCTIHEKAEQNESGKKSQCKKVKKDKKRCKMQTNSKSGYCYYHD